VVPTNFSQSRTEECERWERSLVCVRVIVCEGVRVHFKLRFYKLAGLRANAMISVGIDHTVDQVFG
jgi:hypothetical protein